MLLSSCVFAVISLFHYVMLFYCMMTSVYRYIRISLYDYISLLFDFTSTLCIDVLLYYYIVIGFYSYVIIIHAASGGTVSASLFLLPTWSGGKAWKAAEHLFAPSAL